MLSHGFSSLPTRTEYEDSKLNARLALENIHTLRILEKKIFSNRNNYDEIDALLEDTKLFLALSPDYYTMYNIRRETLEEKWKSCEIYESHSSLDKKSLSQNSNYTLSYPEKTESSSSNLESINSSEVNLNHDYNSFPLVAPQKNCSLNSKKSCKLDEIIAELGFNNLLLKIHPKSYSLFVHRKWLIKLLRDLCNTKILLKELQYIESFLEEDPRNFHIWGYRRWLIDNIESVIPLESSIFHEMMPFASECCEKSVFDILITLSMREKIDFIFSREKILMSFSNYSAWHQRAIIVLELCDRNSNLIRSEHIKCSIEDKGILEANSKKMEYQETDDQIRKFVHFFLNEVDFALRAIYCDPNDQSVWYYLQLLLRTLENLIETVSVSCEICNKSLQFEISSDDKNKIESWLFDKKSLPTITDPKLITGDFLFPISVEFVPNQCLCTTLNYLTQKTKKIFISVRYHILKKIFTAIYELLELMQLPFERLNIVLEDWKKWNQDRATLKANPQFFMKSYTSLEVEASLSSCDKRKEYFIGVAEQGHPILLFCLQLPLFYKSDIAQIFCHNLPLKIIWMILRYMDRYHFHLYNRLWLRLTSQSFQIK